MNEEKIGKFISKLRKDKKLTQNDLAKILHVTDKAISRWETGKGYPDITLLVPLSDALGITVNELLSAEFEKNKNKKTEENIKTTIKISEISMKKKEKTIKYITFVIALITIILLYFSYSLSPLGILELLIISIIFLSISFKKNKNKKTLTSLIIITIFTIYSFFTYDGSVRLKIFLMGHPIKAYTTELKENKNREESNKKYFLPQSDIQVTSGSIGYIECKNYFGLKISSYYGF